MFLLSAATGLSSIVLLTFAYRSYRHLVLRNDQLSESLAQARFILDKTDEMFGVLDEDENMVFYTESASHWVRVVDGKTTLKVLEEPWEGINADFSSRAFEDRPIPRALRGEFVQGEFTLVRNKVTGDVCGSEVSTFPIPCSPGGKRRFLIHSTDTSPQRLYDETRMRLASIVESSQDAIVSVDLKGLVTSWNKGAETIFGYSAAEMLGQDLSRLAVPSQIERELANTCSVLRDEHVDLYDSVRVTKSGRTIDVGISLSPIKNAEGEIIGISRIGRDLTAVRSLERQLQQSQKMEAIGQLTGGIAHDFNNLLGIAIGNLDLLMVDAAGDEATMRRATKAMDAATRCAKLTTRLLAFSTTAHLIPAATSPSQTVRNTLELAGRALGPDIEITVHLDNTLPHLYVDTAGLENALLNVLINARDAMPKGGALTIRTQAVTFTPSDSKVLAGLVVPGNYACISVADSGEGMSKEILNRVFEPFFTTKERGRGTGLGLPMVYGFARQSGGVVSLESEVGQGTKVSIYLPVTNKSPGFVTRGAEAVVPRRDALILLVDDEVEMLEIAEIFLHNQGYRTLQACTAQQALRALEEFDGIDLMLTDILMPGGMNGVELAEIVRARHPATKIIYTSGFPADALAAKDVPLGGNVLLRKPYFLAELGEAVARALSQTCVPG